MAAQHRVHIFETQDPIDALAQAILRALQPGNGRSNRCDVEAELPDRLASDGVTFDVSDLDQALTRLEDCGRIIRTQRQPFSIYPQFLVSSGSGPYDQTDRLAAAVAASIKHHGERFESEDQLKDRMAEDGITYDAQTLAAALHQLEAIGQLKPPRQDQWRADDLLHRVSDVEVQRRDAADRREVNPPIEVELAMWSAGGQLDWWVKERQ
jgi:hypothetical protein